MREDEEALQHVAQKEEEIGRMLQLTEQFHDTINHLKDEIAALQSDKLRLTKLQEKQAALAKLKPGPTGCSNPFSTGETENDYFYTSFFSFFLLLSQSHSYPCQSI